MSDEKIHSCPKCTWPLDRVWSKKKERYYWFCSQPADEETGQGCGAVFSEDASGEPILKHVERGEPDPAIKCPECGSAMQLITGGKFGNFWGCSGREETGCKGTLDILDPSDPHKLPPACPVDRTHGPMRVRAGKNGKFLGCRRFPECNETMELNGKKKVSRKTA